MKTFSLLPVMIALILVGKSSCANPTRYDQRQTGDVNVQVHLKDVQVIALIDTELLDDYTDYNYAYDYSDFTIKPGGKPTTSTPSTTSFKPGTTWPTHPPMTSPAQIQVASTFSPSTIMASTTVKTQNVTTTSPLLNSTLGITETPLTATTKMEEDLLIAVDRKQLSLRSPAKKCRSGFSLDAKGRCRRTLRRRLSLLPLAMKLVPKMTGGTSKDLRVASWIPSATP